MQIQWSHKRLWADLCFETQKEYHDFTLWLHAKAREVSSHLCSSGMNYVFTCKDGLEAKVLAGLLPLLGQEGLIKWKTPLDWPRTDDIEDAVASLQNAKLIRDYQAAGTREALCAPFGRGLLDIATGGGKTRIFTAMVAVGIYLDFPRWLYVVQNKELASQTKQKLNIVLPQMLEVLGVDTYSKEDVVITSYGGIKKLQDKSFDGLVVDEVHCLPAKTRRMAVAQVEALWRIGMSGTPLHRQDEKNLLTIGLLGPVVYAQDIASLAEAGHLSDGLVKSIRFNHAAMSSM